MNQESDDTRVTLGQGDPAVPHSLSVPRATRWDSLHALVRGALGAVPITGGVAAELFNSLWEQPLSKRRDEFMHDVIDRLEDLAQKGELKVEDVVDNPLFTTTLANAARQAVFTHQLEKLVALRNGVLNSRDRQRFDETRSMMYMAILEPYTSLHLKILQQAITNNRLNHLRGTTVEEQRIEAAPIEDERREIARSLEAISFAGFDIVWPALKQLGRDGLVVEIQSGGRLGAALMSIQPTALGVDFWKFFSDENATTGTARPAG